jgi:phenylacetate-coenzyme A ligase PaaK-like adenylate-forming protein
LEVIIVKGVSVNAVEVEVVIIVKEEGEHLYQLVVIALTRILSKI